MKKILLASAALAAAVSPAAENRIVNGGFEAPLKRNLWGSVYGGGPGDSRRSRERPFAGDWCYHLRKERGPGGAQLMGTAPIGGVDAFELRFRYRGGGNFGVSYWHTGADGRRVRTNDATGRPASARIECPAVKEWTAWSRVFKVPASFRLPGATLMLQFQVWGGSSPRDWWLDELELVPCAVSEKKAPPPLNVTVAPPVPPAAAYGPIPFVVRPRAERRDGLLLRDGKPYFWVGNGCDLGSAQATPAGLWLAKLQGASMVALQQDNAQSMKADGTNAVISISPNPGAVSWRREARRLGFLTEAPSGLGPLRWSPFRKYSEAHPDFAEHVYDAGHGISADHRSPLGRKILAANRACYLQCVGADDGHILELYREPGPNPRNRRVRRAFREWAKRKYGTLEEACRVWRRTYPDWESVEPIHLDSSGMAVGGQEIALRRHAKTAWPEFYYDWCRFRIDDNTLGTADEVADVRALAPQIPVTVDVRGHRIYSDTYMAYDPVRMNGLLDLLFIHYGLYSTRYNNTPVHEKTLYDGTCFPLFMYNYFRTNVDLPFIDSEDIVSVARLPGSNAEAMEKNDLAQLHATPWKFRLEAKGEDGLACGWQARGFDDSAWGEIRVPGAWDETADYRGRSGVAWYRKTFRPTARVMDYRDGSRRFLLYGQGVAQRGTLWLNGKKVGDVKGWNTKYSFDVGALLDYGKENTLVFRVEGNGFQNGLRKYVHLLAHDMINEAVPFGRGELESMLWTYMMRGSSGVFVWHWIPSDWLKPYYADVVAGVERAAETVLPDLRRRRSPVAYLYGYLGGFGLPCPSDGSVAPEMSWYLASELNGIRPDVYAEETFVRDVTPARCPLLVVPHVTFVDDATYAHFKRYVRAGGRAVITSDSLRRTFSRYAATDIDAFASAHSSRITVVDAAETSLEAVSAVLRPLLPRPDVRIAGGTSAERPHIERMLAGNAARKVLYLHNWGGMDQTLDVSIDPAYDAWTLSPLIGRFTRTGAPGVYRTTVPAQRPVAVLLTAPGTPATPPPAGRLAAARRRVAELNAPRRTPGRPRVLFPLLDSKYSAASRELFPYILDRLDAMGYETDKLPPKEWTREKLSAYRLIVLPNVNCMAWSGGWLGNAAFADLVAGYVKDGGSLMMLVYTARTANARGSLLRSFARPYGLMPGWERACDPANATFGDPWQITAAVSAGHPLADGVRKLALWTAVPFRLSEDSPLEPVVRVPAGARSCAGRPLVAAGRCGKGRVFVSADVMLFQPFRIEHADNAAFLVNTLSWLLGEKTDEVSRRAFRENLFLTERDLCE